MAPWCLSLVTRRRKTKNPPVYPQYRYLWSSSIIEDHPSAPEAVAPQNQPQDKVASMRLPKDIFNSLQDSSNLIPLVRTEWIEGVGGRYSKDEWLGEQFLLYYETEKMCFMDDYMVEIEELQDSRRGI